MLGDGLNSGGTDTGKEQSAGGIYEFFGIENGIPTRILYAVNRAGREQKKDWGGLTELRGSGEE